MQHERCTGMFWLESTEHACFTACHRKQAESHIHLQIVSTALHTLQDALCNARSVHCQSTSCCGFGHPFAVAVFETAAPLTAVSVHLLTSTNTVAVTLELLTPMPAISADTRGQQIN